MSTPVREQYLRLKAAHPDAVLLFRMGDFYEMFDQDAEIASRELGLTLTGREFVKGVRSPMAGFPYHQLDEYIGRAVERGLRLAIAEQIGDPKAAKGLVERRIVRVVTPGTVREPQLLEGQRNNFLAAIVWQDEAAGIAYADITTGEFFLQHLAGGRILDELGRELGRISPAEALWPLDGLQTALAVAPSGEAPPPEAQAPLAVAGCAMTPFPAEAFASEAGGRAVAALLPSGELARQPYAMLPLALGAAGALLAYLRHTQPAAIPVLRPPTLYRAQDHMALDAPTRRNLELTQTMRAGSPGGSLLAVLDRTRTPMGGRLLRRWLHAPLVVLAPLLVRQEAVARLAGDTALRLRVAEALGGIGDIERLVSRAQQGIANPRDLQALARALDRARALREALAAGVGVWDAEARGALSPTGDSLRACAAALDDCRELAALIRSALVDEPPAAISEGGFIRAGFSEAIDQIDESSRESRAWLAGLEAGERARTGIKSLKVVYSRVFGYALEVSKSNLGQVPEEYIRKQTIVGGERYITPELKQREAQIMQAQERRAALELEALAGLRASVAEQAARLLRSADAVGMIDVYTAFAATALERDYTRPELHEGDELAIEAGRHPVVEVTQREIAFVPNDTVLGPGSRLVVLTGPNMAGKSTYLRQVALIVLLAQVGSFVPAAAARIGLVDRIFTRVGAQDDLAAGQSTFMVEMAETSAILAACTPRSLVILDEIGRGTSTYDGLAIAQAVLEYLHDDAGHRAKTIFATHYHELTALAERRPEVVNFRMEVLEEGERVVFLRRVAPGGADKSYGIYVAQLAGLPPTVVGRARGLLRDYESHGQTARAARRRVQETAAQLQLPLFSPAPG